jgi:hypothetical protein
MDPDSYPKAKGSDNNKTGREDVDRAKGYHSRIWQPAGYHTRGKDLPYKNSP